MIDDLDIPTWTPRMVAVQAIQVYGENARAVAVWCGGWATDDLPWSDAMQCYRRRDDDPSVVEMSGGHEIPLAGAMFPSWGHERVPGGVMLAYGVIVAPGEWVVFVDGRHIHMSDDEFRGRFQ